MKDGKIESFTDLNAWKEGHRLVILIYKITKEFPKSETFSIVDQMRRSSSSVTANNASSRKDFQNKIFISKKESQETKHWLRMLNTCFPEKREEIKILWQEAHELLLIFSKSLSSSKKIKS